MARPSDRPRRCRRVRAQRAKSAGFGPLFTHTAYLINPATSEPVLREKSIRALADELARGSVLGAAGCRHPHRQRPRRGPATQRPQRVGEACVRAFELAGGESCRTRLLLENTAGAGRTFGSTFEELAACMAAAELPEERLGVCLDTCHAWAFGMPVDSTDGWREVISGITECCGIEEARAHPRQRLPVRAR